MFLLLNKKSIFFFLDSRIFIVFELVFEGRGIVNVGFIDKLLFFIENRSSEIVLIFVISFNLGVSIYFWVFYFLLSIIICLIKFINMDSIVYICIIVRVIIS